MKRLERSNGLDTALYKNIPLPFMIAFSEIHISGIHVKSHRFQFDLEAIHVRLFLLASGKTCVDRNRAKIYELVKRSVSLRFHIIRNNFSSNFIILPLNYVYRKLFNN